MHLTAAQMLTLKAYIEADPVLSLKPATAQGAYEIDQILNQIATPDFILWRSNVAADEIGNAWVGTDVDGMSALNMQRLQLLLASSAAGIYDMRRIDRRAGFENPFGTNQNNASRVAMRAVWKRKATVAEKLFATGTGTDASPASGVVEGVIGYQDVGQAMGWSF